MMGVTTAAYWTSWYVWLFSEATMIAILCTIAGTLTIYPASSGGVLLIWHWMYCINFVSFGTLFSCFFDSLVSVNLLTSQWTIF